MKSQAALQGWRALIVVRVCLAFSVTCFFVLTVSAGEISVRLRPLKGAITVTGENLVIRNGAATLFQSQGFGRFTIRHSPPTAVTSGLWDVDDGSGKSKSVVARKIDIFGENTRVDLRPAPPHVQLVARTDGAKLDLVGLMPIEEYIEGVVSGEVPRDWPLEALKAQAVAARSFTVAKVLEREPLAPDWLFEATIQDQVFDHERRHSRATEAVRATEGEVLYVSGGIGHETKVIATNYHSDCGGATDEPGIIWGGKQTKNGTAKDSSCAMKPRNSWRYVADLSDLGQRLSDHGILPAKFRLAALDVDRRSLGGRALDMKARSHEGKFQVFSGERLRAALGYNDLKSTLFSVKVTDTPQQIEFMGKGFGHGTGLCQWGARSLAQSGRSYREILRHYYPRLELNGPKTGSQSIAFTETSAKL